MQQDVLLPWPPGEAPSLDFSSLYHRIDVKVTLSHQRDSGTVDAMEGGIDICSKRLPNEYTSGVASLVSESAAENWPFGRFFCEGFLGVQDI